MRGKKAPYALQGPAFRWIIEKEALARAPSCREKATVHGNGSNARDVTLDRS